MGLISDLDMSSTSDNSFAAAENAANAAHLVSIDSDDSFSQIVTQSTQPEVDHEDYEGYMGNYGPTVDRALGGSAPSDCRSSTRASTQARKKSI